MTGVLGVDVDPRLSNRPLFIPVRIMVCEFWVEIPPWITVMENFPWLKSGADWHMYSDRSVCYELKRRWKDHLAELREKGEEDLADLAAQWILNGTRQVLHVHFTCHKLGMKEWPEEIAPTWPHGEGLSVMDLYEQEIRRCKLRKK